MRFCLEVWGADYPRIERACVLAERLGYDGFYYGESPTGLNLETWAVLGALARATHRIRLGPVIANLLPAYRSPFLLAKQAATLAVLSGGRLDFRTGAGAARGHALPWWRPVGVDYPCYAQRLEVLERGLPVLRALWAGEAVSADLGGVRLAQARLGFAVPQIPVTVAAVGARGLALAARHAEVWEASYCGAAEYADLRRSFETGARRPVTRALEVDAFVAADAPAAAAILDRVRRERAPAGLAEVERRALAGTPEQAAERIAGLAAAGVQQLLLAFHDPCSETALHAFARAMERFRAQR